MYKKIVFLVVAIIISFTMPVFAEDSNQTDVQDVTAPIVQAWNNDALPFLKSIAISFKTDVLNKTSDWFEKTKAIKENDKSFYDVWHKFFTGKDQTEKEN
jgi:hypothetical protein